jgi:hypothetical protein
MILDTIYMKFYIPLLQHIIITRANTDKNTAVKNNTVRKKYWRSAAPTGTRDMFNRLARDSSSDMQRTTYY